MGEPTQRPWEGELLQGGRQAVQKSPELEGMRFPNTVVCIVAEL